MHASQYAKWLVLFCAGSCWILMPVGALAHELWVLTPDQERFWRAQPVPRIFSELTFAGLMTSGLFLGVIMAALVLHYGVKPRWLAMLSGQTRWRIDYIPLVLRLTAGWGLLTSAYGIEKRAGSDILRHPLLFAPDLRLCAGGNEMGLGDAMVWLVMPEALIGALLIFGLWVRAAALGLVLLITVGVYMFGGAIMAYAPIWLAVAIYLFYRGAGPYAVSCFGTDAALRRAGIEPDIPFRHAQMILRVLTGLNFIYLGIRYKIMEPSLAMGVLVEGKVPILSLFPEYAVFVMACVEITFGILIAFGIIVRPAAIILFAAFFFFATFLDESYTAHMVYYGSLIAMLMGGPGRFREEGLYQPAASPAHVLPDAPRVARLLHPVQDITDRS